MAPANGGDRPLLIDTNIFLGYLLSDGQSRANEKLFKRIDRGELDAYVLKFALHSIEIILTARKKHALLNTFLEEVGNASGLTIYPTAISEEQGSIPFTKKLASIMASAISSR